MADTEYDRGFSAGVILGFVLTLIIGGTICSLAIYGKNFTIKTNEDEIKTLKADAVKYGFGDWVTGKEGTPEFKWVVPAESPMNGEQ